MFEHVEPTRYDEGVAGDDMSAFDRLPRVVRDALQVTSWKWNAADALAALMQGIPAHNLAQYITKMDADHGRT